MPTPTAQRWAEGTEVVEMEAKRAMSMEAPAAGAADPDPDKVTNPEVSKQAGYHQEGEVTRGLPWGSEAIVDAARACTNCVNSAHSPRAVLK